MGCPIFSWFSTASLGECDEHGEGAEDISMFLLSRHFLTQVLEGMSKHVQSPILEQSLGPNLGRQRGPRDTF